LFYFERYEMKKLILVLAVLLAAAPVWAALDVNLVLVDSDTVAVVYAGADVANLPRAFALTVTLNGTTGTFTAINGYKTGESTSASKGFGIYPARIAIDSTGTVTNYGNPLADTADPGAAGTGLGTKSVVLEFGSLYYGDTNAPATSGTLCTLDFTKGDATQISLATETTYRGGIVLEDGTQTSDTAMVTIFVDPTANTCWDATKCPRQTFGDATCDGAVNLADLYALKAAWGASGPPWVGSKCCADFTRDKAVNLADLYKLKANWGSTGTGTATQTCPAQ